MVILNMLNAWLYTCFGPIIPYYILATGLNETHDSYLFIINSVPHSWSSNILFGLSFIQDPGKHYQASQPTS
jgi:hypothetical protein